MSRTLAAVFVLLAMFDSTFAATATKDKAKDKAKDKQTIGTTKDVKKACDKRAIDMAYQKCVKGGGDRTKCKETLTKETKDKCGTTVSGTDAQKLSDSEANKALAQCKMQKDAKKEDCDKKAAAIRGTKSPVKDKTKAAVLDKADAEKGARDVLGEEMAKCNGDKACIEKVKQKMSNLKGKTVSKGDFASDLRDAGKSAAGSEIKACISKATTTKEKQACTTSADAKKKFAAASGLKEKDINDVDMKKAANNQAQREMKETMRACVETAGDDATAKKACYEKTDMKSVMAASSGRDKSSIKDSEVKKGLTKGAQKDTLDVMKNCDKTKKDEAAKCLELMKERKAALLGKDASKVTTDEIKRDARQALVAELAEKMVACVGAAGDDKTELAKCTTMATEAIKAADLDGKTPTDAEVQRFLQEACMVAAKDILKECDDAKDVCMTLVKTRLSMVMGSGKSISTKDAAVMSKKGATKDVTAAVMACKEARKANTDATCDDPYDTYLKSSKSERPKSKTEEQTQKTRVMVNAAKSNEQSVRNVCYEKKDRDEAKKCMESFKKERDEVNNEALKSTKGTDKAKILKSRTKQAEDSATNSYLGDRMSTCMKAAKAASDPKAEMKKCQTDFEEKSKVAGKSTDKKTQKTVLTKYNAKKVAEAANACGDKDRKTCMKEQMEDFVASGGKERTYNSVKKTGEIMSSAEVYAACKQEAGTDTDCDALAQAEFVKVSGADAAAYAGVKDKIVKLAGGLENGKDIEVRTKAQLGVDAKTNGNKCDTATQGKITEKVKKADVTPKLSGAKGGGCRMVDGKPEYNTQAGTKGFTEEQTEAAADKLSTAVKGTVRRLLSQARRLAEEVTSSYAAPEVELCAGDDSSCGATDTDMGGSGATTSGSSTGTSATTSSSVRGHVRGAAILFSLLAMVHWA